MRCIYCGEKMQTINSRANSKGFRTWRRRQCKSCGAVFTTNERADLESALRVKRKSQLEPFLYEKLFIDVHESLTHRETAYMDAEQLTDTMVLKLLPCETGTLQVSEIKSVALEVLKRFDKAAFTYYAAHHKPNSKP